MKEASYISVLNSTGWILMGYSGWCVKAVGTGAVKVI